MSYPFKRPTVLTIEGVQFEVWSVGVLRSELRSVDGRIVIHARDVTRNSVTGSVDGTRLPKRYRSDRSLVKDALRRLT